MSTYKAKNFVKNVTPRIHVDRAFQRKVCWSDKTCREYILSVNRQRAPYPIVVADVKSGLKKSEKLYDDYGIEKYKKAQNLNKDFISLDGQNRAEALRKLFSGKLTLTGRFIDADGKEVNVDNKYYSGLPYRLQDALRDAEVSICILPDCSYDELHDIFVHINSGDALNAQEKRNAINTLISSFIRERAEEAQVATMWPKISGMDESKINRSLDSEWTIKAYMATLGGDKYDLNPKYLDAFYNLGKNKPQTKVPAYSRKNQNRFCSIFKELSIMISSLKLKNDVPQKMWWLSLYVMEYLHDNGNNCVNYSDLYEIMSRIDTDLINESRKEHAKKIESWEKLGKPEGSEPSKSDYYFQWASMPRAGSDRKKRKTYFFARLVADQAFIDLMNRSTQSVAK